MRDKIVALVALVGMVGYNSSTMAQEIVYGLADSSATFSLTVENTSEGTYERNEDGSFLTINGKKVPAFNNEWTVYNSSEMPVTYTDEYAAKMSKSRVGNKEILMALTNAIPELNATGISGWKIMYVHAGYGYGFFKAVRNGDEINLSEYVSMSHTGAYVNSENYTYKESYKYSITDGTTTTATVSFSGKEKSQVMADFAMFKIGTNVYENISVNGVRDGSYKSYSWYPDPLDKSSIASLPVPGSSRISGLVGSDDSEELLVTGGITIAASKVVKQ